MALTACSVARPPEPAGIAALSRDLGQLLLVGVRGTEAEGNLELEALLCEARIGGVVLFARNIVDAAQLARLTGAMQARSRACTGRPLLVAVDAEGGRVMRLAPRAGYTGTLSADELGRGNDVAVTELEARRIGAMLRAAGINWDLAPVVDVGYNPANPVIVGHGRAFGADPARVVEQAQAFVRGLHEAGILTALKHFPGHGSSYADSHVGFVDVTETARPEVELAPYRALIAAGLADSVMTAHVVNRWVDDRFPATLSWRTITGVLRRDLGFQGPVVSDDLRMGAIEQRYGMAEAAQLALAAGVDVLLIADDRLPDGRSASSAVLAALRAALAEGRLAPGRVAEALARVAALKERI
jgi:beta-N-acetylhexosaminidase